MVETPAGNRSRFRLAGRLRCIFGECLQVGGGREVHHNQKQHHRRMSFQDEFRELCRRHGLELDERYAWD